MSHRTALSTVCGYLLRCVGLCVILPCLGTAQQGESDTTTVREDMALVYRAFRDLQPFLYARKEFVAPSNEERIKGLLNVLASRFHRVEMRGSYFAQEPGFASTLKMLNEMLDDARYRFSEGKKGYALWRLKSSTQYCVSCHTRYEVPAQFFDTDAKLNKLNTFEQAEFFLASRQFDRAAKLFLAVVTDVELTAQRIEALRNWLIIYTRVSPDPAQALITLNGIQSKVRLSVYENEEVLGWIGSLRRWQNESRNTSIPALVKAENLVRQGITLGENDSRSKGTVELLRASALLHKALEGKPTPKLKPTERSHVRYLLGLLYSELPLFFVNELPELFLEQAIQEAPGSEEAKQAFRLYREIVTLNYTGSGGTRLPDDVLLKLREWHDLAYGVPMMKGQV